MDHVTSPIPAAAGSLVSSGAAVAGGLNAATEVSLFIAAIGGICAIITTSLAVYRFMEERKAKARARSRHAQNQN